ncbi:MAG: TPM domain-containing protein [Candidatus Bathyarchaeota archaeon]|nr:TPM domain-containing protein [Candidatus Bathyarchaeum sp.]
MPRTPLFSFLLVMVLASLVSIPVSVVPVNGQVISDDWKYDIESYLLDVDTNTTAEIVIYVVDSLYGHGITKDGVEINDIVQLGVYIFNELPLDTPSGSVVGIGKKGKDNGVLVLVAMEEREWRIEIGYGLEGYITDVESRRIAEEYLVPKFQEGEYGEGFAYTVIALTLEIPVVDETDRMSTRGRYVYDNAELSYDEEIPVWVIVLIVIFVGIMIVFGGRFGGGRRGRGWGGGYGGGGRSGGGGGGGRSGGGGSGGGW